MRVLQVKFKGYIPTASMEVVKEEIKRSISEGFIIHDDGIELNVLEFDDVRVDE